MHVNGGRTVEVVLEDHRDGVADGGADDRAQHAQVLLCGAARLQFPEGRVGVLPVQGLDVARADAVRALPGEDGGRLVERLTGELVRSGRRIVPNRLVGRDEVAPDLRNMFALGRDGVGRPANQAGKGGQRRNQREHQDQ
jgi:hypothetical protein